MLEPIHSSDKGEHVRVHQGHLNDRLRARGQHPIDADGVCGPQTVEQSAFVAWLLGAMDTTVAEIRGGSIGAGVQGVIADPGSRNADQRKRAADRKGKTFPGAGANGSGKTLTGIDVSNNNPSIDWTQVRADGHSFAFHKVTEGLGTPDHKFGKVRWQAMHDAGLVRGVYHFACPQKGRDPKAEVREFLGFVKQAGGLQSGDLRPVLDFEKFGRAGNLTPQQTLVWARGFVDEVQARIGCKPIIYTGSFWRDAVGNPADNLGCRLWLAAYVAEPQKFVPTAWKQESFSIHQFTDKGSCTGVGGNVDLNRMPGGSSALDALRIH